VPPVPAPDTGPDAGAIWHYGDPLGEQRRARTAAVVIDRSHRPVLTISGPDRLSWLHTLCTQYVEDLPDGATVANLCLDGRGRVQDHWIQTELAAVSYLDTEPGRGEALLNYLTSMVFWADVSLQTADLAVLSLLGPGLTDPRVPAALGITALPDAAAAVALPTGGLLRRMPGAPAEAPELDALVPREQVTAVLDRLAEAGVHPAGVWTFEAHRVAAVRPRLGVDTDERTIPHEMGWIGGPGTGAVHLNKGCYRGQETVARVHNLGKPPRMLALLHLDGSVDRPAPGDPVTAGGRTVGRLGTVVDHDELGPIALALLKRALPADTALLTGENNEVAAVIDVDSLPPPDAPGAGRLAVERLRGR